MRWPLLEALDADERDAVLAAARSRSYGKGEIVFAEGDPADSVQLVVSGYLAVRVSTPDGDLATLNILGPGAWFGELSLLRDQAPQERSATVLALDAADVLVLTQKAFHALGDVHPRIDRLVVAMMAARVRELSGDLLEARFVSLERRVCGGLLRLADVYGDGDRPASVVPVSQENLAGLVGGARPRVNEALQTLVADAVVELGRGKVVILDRAELARRT